METQKVKEIILQDLQDKKDRFVENIIKMSFDFKNDWDKQINKIASLEQEEQKEDKLNK